MTPDQVQPLLNAVPMPLVLIGGDERIVTANHAAEAVLGRLSPGRHYVTVLRHPAVLDCVETALRGETPPETRFPQRDATRDTTYAVRAAPIRLGMAQTILLSLEDIGHVQAASQMRRDFVANVSHELRSPLTALMGFIETLLGPARDDRAAQDRFLGMMQNEADRMSRLIHDLLSLSRVESTERQRPTGRADIASLVASASMSLGPMLKDRGVTLHVTGTDEPAEVPGDGDQILQVLTNLMENAAKYGGGRIEVALSRHDRDPALRAPSVRVEVRDNGAGIDPVHIPRLTERFYRADTHRSRDEGGTGLGLAIVKHIVNRHRGRLKIDSAPGRGSTFSVIFPAE